MRPNLDLFFVFILCGSVGKTLRRTPAIISSKPFSNTILQFFTGRHMLACKIAVKWLSVVAVL